VWTVPDGGASRPPDVRGQHLRAVRGAIPRPDGVPFSVFRSGTGERDLHTIVTNSGANRIYGAVYGALAGVEYGEPFIQKEVGLVHDLVGIPVASM
jgi:hypothetical protein